MPTRCFSVRAKQAIGNREQDKRARRWFEVHAQPLHNQQHILVLPGLLAYIAHISHLADISNRRRGVVQAMPAVAAEA